MSKYRNKRTVVDGISFDSMAEANRYGELQLLLKAGEIDDLEIHPVYELQQSFRRNGKTIRAIKYEADFCYSERASAWRTIVEDTKGARTQVFNIKMKMLLFKYPDMDFRIVEA